MTFQQKNVAVSLGSFTLIMVFFLISVFQMFQTGTFNSENVIRLWIIVIGLAVVFTILATILTHIVVAIIDAIKTQKESDVDDTQDERDTMIDLRGTKITYLVSSLGVFFSMLTFALGQPPLVMFTLLIFFGVAAQIVGDVTRLSLYQRGI